MALKIGVFDSGIGGITVLSELRQNLGHLDYVYLGDTAHVPYGTKSPAQIERLSLNCVNLLKEKKIDALVVACNTASSWALKQIKEAMTPLPVFGMVEPGIHAALEALTDAAPILVLATPATVGSQAYSQAFRTQLLDHPITANQTEPVSIFEQACALLVPMIEEGWIDHPILHQTISEYVKPYLGKGRPGVALLGCTHYPWIHHAFEKALPGWTVVNSARAIVSAFQQNTWIQEQLKHLAQNESNTTLKDHRGAVEWIFTDPAAVPKFARHWIAESN